MSKAENMLAILLLLRSRERLTARQLAKELEIHVRTVYRLIDALCMSGVPVVSETGRNGGYYIPDHFKLEPLFFDPEEQKALLQAARFARDSGYPHEAALARAVAKIKRYAGEEQAKRLEAQEAGLEAAHPPMDAELKARLAMLEKATDAARSVEIRYEAGYSEATSKRLFDPYGLVNWKGKWYAAGYCHLRGEIRHFRVDRIRGLRLTGQTFVRPRHFSARQSLLENLLPGMEGGDEEHLVPVYIEGPPSALDDLCGHWLFARALKERTENQAHFRMDEHSLYLNAPYYLLSFGGKIRIAHPPELRECMAEIAESLLRYYRS